MDATPQFNEAYIKAKEKQAATHAVSSSERGSDNRLPPGQMITKGFPILDLGVRPSRDRYSRWTLEIRGKVGTKKILTIDELKQLEGKDITADFHCVTRWTRYDLHWTGIPFEKIISAVAPNPSATFVILRSFEGYSTNVLLEELKKPNVIIAYALEGGEIPPEHGGPIRMVIPHLYGWKSAKFLTTIEFCDTDEPGFWEVRGYSNAARPWREERYG